MEKKSYEGEGIHVEARGSRVNGKISEAGIASFLGIPFARVVKRFRLAQKVDLASLGPRINAASYGPRCPQHWNRGPERRAHLYEGVESASNHPVSEKECLNLNIYVPADALSANTKLPVLVWIHGGGWVFGDGGPEYDGNFLVKESCQLRQPFVFVTINYRLGYYGFLSSKELRMEAEANNEGYCPNPGLHDQRLALQWVQENITHFGGDSSRVTIAGQSAGAWSALSHLVTDVPLCSRGFIMSATVISFPCATECQETFDKLVARAGVPAEASGEDKLEALRNLNDEQMTQWLDGAVLIRPSWDPEWFSSLEGSNRLDQVTKFPDWVQGIVIGSTKDETANIRPFWHPFSSETIFEAVKSIVPGKTIANEVTSAYRLESASHSEVLDGLVNLTTESFFGLFPPALGELHAPISVYRFDQPDTFDQSIYKGQAYHCLDLPFLCRLPAVAGPSADCDLRSTSDAMTKAITTFINGEQPWEPFHKSRTVMIFNGKDSGTTQWPRHERWRQFFTTPRRSTALVDTGRLLMTYNLASIK